MINQSTQPAGNEVATSRSNGGVAGERYAWSGDGLRLRRSGSTADASGIGNFDCYRLAIEFAALAATLVPRGHAALRDQLERASTSALLNCAEAYGRWQPREKAHLYTIARGSLLESGAAIDLVRARGLAGEIECERARVLCTRVGQMLNGLIRAMERRQRGLGARTAVGSVV